MLFTSQRPPALVRAGVYVHPALCPACLDRVAAHAAPAGHQAFGVGGHSQRVSILHLNVRGPAQQVLAGSGAAHLCVVAGGAVAAGDGHGLAEVLPDALQQHHKALVNEDGVGAVAAAELPHAERGGELRCAVLLQAILFDRHMYHVLSRGQAPIFTFSSSY